MTLFRAEFCQWMEAVTRQEGVGVEGFRIGRRLQVYLSDPELDTRRESWMPSSLASRNDNTRSIFESAPGGSFEPASGSSDAAQELRNGMFGNIVYDTAGRPSEFPFPAPFPFLLFLFLTITIIRA